MIHPASFADWAVATIVAGLCAGVAVTLRVALREEAEVRPRARPARLVAWRGRASQQPLLRSRAEIG